MIATQLVSSKDIIIVVNDIMIEVIMITITGTVGLVISVLKIYKKSQCTSKCCDVILETEK